MPNLRNGSKGGFEPGLTRLRVRHSTTELPRSTLSSLQTCSSLFVFYIVRVQSFDEGVLLVSVHACVPTVLCFDHNTNNTNNNFIYTLDAEVKLRLEMFTVQIRQ